MVIWLTPSPSNVIVGYGRPHHLFPYLELPSRLITVLAIGCYDAIVPPPYHRYEKMMNFVSIMAVICAHYFLMVLGAIHKPCGEIIWILAPPLCLPSSTLLLLE